MQDEDILKETHALKSDLNGLLLLTDARSGLGGHTDENVRQKMALLKKCAGHMLMRVRNIEKHLTDEDISEFDEFFERFDIPKPKGY